ncbi:MAG TPA: hypothetical protein VJ971_09065 [Methylomirabilota bacterium]|nr:hypothetical protein [Methylomirabilota bacterium]
MGESTLYHTFSTIPQTLGGGAAILVAVVLYRLAEIDRTIDRATEYLEAAWQGYPLREVWRALERQGWKGVERALRRLDPGPAVGAAEQNACRRAYRAMQARRQIVFLLYSALGFTVIDILVCITSIPVTPNLLRSPADAMQVVVGAIALTSICLGFYARLIWAMVQPIARR